MIELQEEQLVDQIRDAQAFLRDIKNSQFIGASDLRIIRNSTSATYDKSATLSQTDSTIITVTFDANKQDYTFATLDFTLYRDGTAPGNIISRMDGATVVIHERITDVSNKKRTTWNIDLQSNAIGTHTYYLKLYVDSTDTGTIG